MTAPTTNHKKLIHLQPAARTSDSRTRSDGRQCASTTHQSQAAQAQRLLRLPDRKPELRSHPCAKSRTPPQPIQQTPTTNHHAPDNGALIFKEQG